MLLRQFVAGFILVIFMAQTFSNAIIVADYYTNTASFAAQCENKDKPQIHCNGQCQMVKQMEKEESGSKPFSSASKEKNDIQLFYGEEQTFEFSLPATATQDQQNNCSFCMQQCITNIFHPPSLA